MFHMLKYRPWVRTWGVPDMLDRLFQETLPEWGENLLVSPESRAVAVDVLDKEDHYIIKAEVPGFMQGEIDITVDGDLITLKGEKKEEEQETYFCKESEPGKFTRTVKLGTEVKKEGIKAKMKDGILTIELPKVELKKPHKVTIEG